MAAKRQKFPEQLQGRGSRHRGEQALVLVAPDARRSVPDAPPGLPAALRPVWEAYWADPVSQLVTGADGYDVARYFTLLAERARHERAISRTPLVVGSMGQEVVNPRLALVKELTREIEKTREQLGILPQSRLRLGLVHSQTAVNVASLRKNLDYEPQAHLDADVVLDLDTLG